MSAVADAILDHMAEAEWPPEAMELAMDALADVGWDGLTAELKRRSEKSCAEWRVCLVQASDVTNAELCDTCPLKGDAL